MAEVMAPASVDILPDVMSPDLIDGGTDGRLTPLASESSRLSRSASSNPSDPAPTSPGSSIGHTIDSSSASLTQPPTQPAKSPTPGPPTSLFVPGAEFGYGSLAAETQLREAMTGKDRIFALMLSKEIEDFVAKAFKGNRAKVEMTQELVTSAPLSAFENSIRLTSHPTSKYQRMIIYKAAEWYGIRAIMPQEGVFVVGTLEGVSEKSLGLRMCDLAPRPPTPKQPKQSFKIMQRVPMGSAGSASSRAGSVAGDENEAGGSKRKTLEQREADYALARERIYGKDDVAATSAATSEIGDGEQARGRAVRRVESDDEDFIPRQSYNHVQPVYASLYHPKTPSAEPTYDTSDPAYAHAPTPEHYGYIQQPQPMLAYADPMGNAYGHTPYPPRQGGYTDGSIPPFIPHTMYGPPAWPTQNGQGQIPPPHLVQLGWQYAPMPPNGVSQPMPVIPQGIQPYPPQQYHPLQHPPQQQYNGHLVQPTPVRPGLIPHHHSSTSSSISSRSYQDHSRPHSRGSTTSTRSAASSVRIGAMYPANNQTLQGYRQRVMKGQPLNSLTSLNSGERTSTRGHSPSSVTSGSSRSSRRANSISVQPPLPGQHQLPTRPNWAANNIPYHPSPVVNPQYPGMMPLQTNPSDFPPLLRNGTNAEPMQVERAKMRGSQGNVWNGTAVRTARYDPGHQFATPPMSTQGSTPVSPTQSVPPPASSVIETDPDFPRRMPHNRQPGVLYDPSANKAAPPPLPDSAITVSHAVSPQSDQGEMSVQDEIEAKLAALSVTSGIAIGPPPNKAPSYAKIVRRD